MNKPRIFLGSSAAQKKLVQALTRGLEDVAHVDPWTMSFNPGTSTLTRLLELTREVDFAAFVFARDDWTTASHPLPLRGFRPGFSARQCRLRSRSFRRRPWPAPNLHPACERCEASDRSPRTDVRTIRRSDERCRGEDHQPEDSKGDRERGPRRTHRGPVVAILPVGTQRERAFRRKPPAHLARRQRRAGGAWPLMAGGRHFVRQILERGHEGEEGACRRLLLLERRTATRPERTAIVRNGRDPAGVCRSRRRVLDDPFGRSPRA